MPNLKSEDQQKRAGCWLKQVIVSDLDFIDGHIQDQSAFLLPVLCKLGFVQVPRRGGVTWQIQHQSENNSFSNVH